MDLRQVSNVWCPQSYNYQYVVVIVADDDDVCVKNRRRIQHALCEYFKMGTDMHICTINVYMYCPFRNSSSSKVAVIDSEHMLSR